MIKRYQHCKFKKCYATLFEYNTQYSVHNFITGEKFNLPHYLVENSLDWELITKKNYEILAVRYHLNGNKALHTLRKDGRFIFHNSQGTSNNGTYTLKEMLNEIKNGKYKIHTVNRLRDNQIFSIGDIIYLDLFGQTEIQELYLKENDDRIWFKSNTLDCPLEHWSLISNDTPLITTEDGVKIFNINCDYKLYYVVEDNNKLKAYECFENEYWENENCEPYENVVINKLKWFSSKEKADEYILFNQKILSLKDVKNYIIHSTQLDELKSLINKRMNNEK